jgi:hypothetical protein
MAFIAMPSARSIAALEALRHPRTDFEKSNAGPAARLEAVALPLSLTKEFASNGG